MHNMHGGFLLHGGPLPQRTRCGASAPRTSLLCVLPVRGRQVVVLQRCARQTLLRVRSTSVSPTTVQRRGLASIPQGRPIFMGCGAEACMGDSPENSRVIFIRGGEPWLMRYCWRTYFHAIQPRWLRWILQVPVSSTMAYARRNFRPWGVRQQYPLEFSRHSSVPIMPEESPTFKVEY